MDILRASNRRRADKKSGFDDCDHVAYQDAEAKLNMRIGFRIIMKRASYTTCLFNTELASNFPTSTEESDCPTWRTEFVRGAPHKTSLVRARVL